MRVLQVVEACGAGVGRHVIGLCCGLISEGHEVAVAYAPHRLDGAFKRFLFEQRDKIRFFPLKTRRGISPDSDLRDVARLLRLIRREGPFDIVHGHSSKGGGLARLSGRLCGLPTVYTPHSLITSSPEISRSEALAYGLIERALGRFATTKMIAVSEEEREFILRSRLVPDSRVALVENGLDEQIFDSLSGKAPCENLEEKPLTFGSAMRFSAQKAPGHLVEAFARVTETLPHVPMRLMIAGDGDLFDEVKDRVEQSGLNEKVLLPGWLNDTKAFLRELDVFVLSSLYEGFSYAVLEAMAAELPLVSTRVFGMSRTLEEVPGNVLVPAGDPDALAEGMQRTATLDEPASLRPALRKIGQANREHVRDNFMQQQTLRRTAAVYQKLA